MGSALREEEPKGSKEPVGSIASQPAPVITTAVEPGLTLPLDTEIKAAAA